MSEPFRLTSSSGLLISMLRDCKLLSILRRTPDVRCMEQPYVMVLAYQARVDRLIKTKAPLTHSELRYSRICMQKKGGIDAVCCT